ncbi:hypothetical protein N9W51_01160 [Alphaproteobacteria bacterium]|nr:hypothetical protein [Alphaproteobacteria bacterium]
MKLIKKIKIIFIIFSSFLYFENLLANEIVFQKKGVIITSIDLKNYKNLHDDYHGQEIGNSKAIKNLYMIFTIVNKQIEGNPNFIKITNNIIKKDVQKFKEIYSEYIISYFLRYEILKNDFISLHIDKNGVDILDKLFNDKINLSSDESCEVISQAINFRELKIKHKKSILTNISNDSILIDENSYACLSKKNKEKIYNLTQEILSKEGNEKFLKYVHRSIK